MPTRSDKDKSGHRLTATLVAIMKDEGRDAAEWAIYHRLLGFDKIVIYDNESGLSSQKVLEKLKSSGIVEIQNWSAENEESPQLSAYLHAKINCTTEWLMFLDADEFLNLKEHDDLQSFLSSFEDDVSSIGVNWRIFGSSGRSKTHLGLVIESYINASHSQSAVNRHLKSISKVKYIAECHIHFCSLTQGKFVDPTGVDILHENGISSLIDHKLAQINHYVIKSEEDFNNKKMRGNANRNKKSLDKFKRTDRAFFDAHDLNDVIESGLIRYSSYVRGKLILLGLMDE